MGMQKDKDEYFIVRRRARVTAYRQNQQLAMGGLLRIYHTFPVESVVHAQDCDPQSRSTPRLIWPFAFMGPSKSAKAALLRRKSVKISTFGGSNRGEPKKASGNEEEAFLRAAASLYAVLEQSAKDGNEDTET